MIEMADKRLPPVEMGVNENCIEVVILKGAAKGTDVCSHGDHDEKGTQEQGTSREAVHGVVILYRALIV